MKTTYIVLLSFLLVLAAGPTRAGSVSGLTNFTAGTTAKSSEVNGNFTTVQTAVNDNDSRLTTVEGTVSTNTSDITTLKSNPSITGNLTLPNSTSISVGNILKGTSVFLQNYGTGNTFVGEGAGNFSLTGTYNTAEGASSLAYDISGSYNTASGVTSLYSNTTGSNNSAFGYTALLNNLGGYGNTAIGDASLRANTSGYDNTAVGYLSLQGNSAGVQNTALGWESLYSNSGGSANVAVGDYALVANTSGSSNIAIGPTAGDLLDTGSFNIDIGNEGNSGEGNTIRIGNIQQSATFIAGISGTTVSGGTTVVVDSNGQLGVATSSRKLKDHIRPMGDASDVLSKLKPVTFYYKSDHNPRGRQLQYGLVAEDVAKVAPELVAHNKDGSVETVYYRFLAPMLLNQYQKQQKVIAEQAKEIVKLKRRTAHMAALEAKVKEIDVLKRQMARLTTVLASRNRPERVAVATNP